MSDDIAALVAYARKNYESMKPDDILTLLDALESATKALTKIDEIRNSIIGRQGINWSLHIFPLVAALEVAGYHGEEYDVARLKAEAEVAALRAALAVKP